jgi:hypothetical protein
LARGVVRVAGNAVNDAMVYDRGLLAGVTPQPNRMFVPATLDEAKNASRMLKTTKPEDVWRETGVGKYGGEYVKEISDKPAKFNTAQEIASDAQKIRDRNVELKQTIKESQSTYPDLFPKELTAARRPLREEIKSNQNMLERNYGYESDPKWAGNFAQLAYEHPELYKEFPELKNLVIRQGREGGPYLGSYERIGSQPVGSVDVYGQSLLGNPKSTATHEMQHAVQDMSGWQSGGTPEQFMSHEVANGFTPFENYQRLGGEAQARLAQTRLDLTPEERLQYYPFAQGKYGLDVSPDELMFDTGLLGQQAKSALSDLSYRGSHTAPSPEFGAPLHDLTGGGQMYPADVYSPKAAQYYGTGYPKADKEAFALANKVRGNPDAEVTMYRAVPKDESIANINAGDWVTLSKDYAKNHGESVLGNDYKILSQKVKAKDLWTNADSIHEFGYQPQAQGSTGLLD